MDVKSRSESTSKLGVAYNISVTPPLTGPRDGNYFALHHMTLDNTVSHTIFPVTSAPVSVTVIRVMDHL